MSGRHFHMHPEAERRHWQNPESILVLAGLRPGMTFVDLGCGNGFFALPAARAVGTDGRVLALDADPELVEELRQRAEERKVKNLFASSGRAEDAILCERCADIVFMGNVLHDFDDPALVLANARTMLRPGGVLVDLDWKDEPSPVGPPMSIRFSAARAGSLLATAGLEAGPPLDVGPYHYLIIARPRVAQPSAGG
jgi:ubiquinone/menaquinone biosynthesis C-methylase UbiE